jgi:protein-disulfide isomerase
MLDLLWRRLSPLTRRVSVVCAAVVALGIIAGAPVLARTHHHAPKVAAVAAKAQAPAQPAVIATVVPGSAGLLPDMTLGRVDAPVTVVEYASAACPHCAEWNATVWPQFQAKYIATGQVHYIFREVLTNPQEYALSAFMIGRCAVAQSKNPTNSAPYFAVVESFFAGQPVYYKTGQLSSVLADVSRKTGLSQKAMMTCVSDGPQGSAFMSNMSAHMTADKVNETPTFFVNGKRMDDRELKDFDTAIAAAQAGH